MLLSTVPALALLQACVLAAPAPLPFGIQFDKRSSLPTVTFPDATYRASKYDSLNDIYTFANIRFAAPPVGNLRWAKPSPALKNSTIQDGSYGNACPQAAIKGLNFFGSASDIPAGTAIDEFINDLAGPLFETGGAEDCLFLDIYVPGNAVRNPTKTKLPVVHWIYGGGFVLGSKNQLQPELPFYDGSGLLTQSGNNVIFVGSNYRLGAFGFLAGSTMEKDGQPNAGLLDQHAALQWTKDNIALVGGDPNTITAMGESAGASSLLHHMVFEGGTVDPIFKRAILQSPAFQPIFDRKGSLEAVYQNFTKFAGCTDGSIACLRSKDTATLLAANSDLMASATPGTFIVGPSPDGSLIRQTPALEYATGNFNKAVTSLLISHTSSESTLFVDGEISTDAKLESFIDSIFPAYAKANGLDTAVLTRYPSPSAQGSPYSDEGDRVRTLIRDSSFTCNTRYLTDAYAGKTYNMQYSITPGWHATDLIPMFWSTGLSSSVLGDALELALPLISFFAYAYKSYMTSFIRAGNPNTHRAAISVPLTINWPVADGSGDQVSGVVNAGDLGFSTVKDAQNTHTICNWWVEFLSAGTIGGGYSPPGALVPTTLISSTAGASSNY